MNPKKVIFKHGIHFHFEKKQKGKYINVVIYKNNGKEIGSYQELYHFNEDGLAIVKSRYHNFFGEYSFITKNGNLLSTPFKSTEQASINTVEGLKVAIEDIGAVAVKYASDALLSEERLTEVAMNKYKEALKKYLIFSDLFSEDNKTDEEIKALINKEYDLFKSFIDPKFITIKEKNEKMNRIKLKSYIDDLIK